MSKTKPYNPFSETLMNLIDGVYSKNTKLANKSFIGLVNYFKTGLATEQEVYFLVMTNDNDVVKLLCDLGSHSKSYELLRFTVGKVVSDAVPELDTDCINVVGDTSEFV